MAKRPKKWSADDHERKTDLFVTQKNVIATCCFGEDRLQPLAELIWGYAHIDAVLIQWQWRGEPEVLHARLLHLANLTAILSNFDDNQSDGLHIRSPRKGRTTVEVPMEDIKMDTSPSFEGTLIDTFDGHSLVKWASADKRQLEAWMPKACTINGKDGHWCTECHVHTSAANRILQQAVENHRYRRVNFSTSPTSPWMLFSYDTADNKRWASFALLHMPTLTEISELALDYGPEGTDCHPSNIMLTRMTYSDRMWATTRTVVNHTPTTTLTAATHTQPLTTNKSYFWYGMRYLGKLDEAKDMHLHRHLLLTGAPKESVCQMYRLPGTLTKDGYGECELYSDQEHLWCYVSRPYCWEINVQKIPLKPKLFHYDSTQDVMVEVILPEQQWTRADWTGQLSPEDLQVWNEDRAEYSLWENGVTCADKTMMEYEDAVYDEFVRNQDTTQRWQLRHLTVIPESGGDIFLNLEQHTAHIPFRCQQETWYYAVAQKKWYSVTNWDLTGRVSGPLPQATLSPHF